MIISRATQYFKREPFVLVMLVILAGVIGLSHLPGGEQGEAQNEPLSKESRLETTRQIKDLSEDLMKDFSKNRPLILGSLLIFGFVLLGVLIDFCAFLLYRNGKRWQLRFNALKPMPWGWGEAFKIFVILLFSELIISLALNFIMMIYQKVFGQADLGSGFHMMIATLIRSIFIFAYICHLVRTKYKRSLADLGLVFQSLGKQIGLGVVTYIGMVPIYLLALIALSWIIQLLNYEPPVQTPVQIFYMEKSNQLLIIFSVIVGILGPFFEELFFRGFIYQAIKPKLGVMPGIFVTSAIFTLLHFHWVAIVPIFILGFVLNYIFERTGSIIPGSILHATHNTVMLILTFQIKGLMA